MTNEKHPKHDWWLTIRDSGKFNERQKRINDVMYGVAELYKYPKTHHRLLHARYAKKQRKGLRDKGCRLSNKLKVNGIRGTKYHLKPHSKTVKGIIWHNTSTCWKKPRCHNVKEYGRRHALIISPRIDRHIQKYGPLGG
jgi:hypothetical protein